jgi:hypothetical protein
MLELQLDRYPTNPAMLTFVQSLLYAGDASDAGGRGPWASDYRTGLQRAANLIRQSETPMEAVASLHGYQKYMAARLH